MAHLSSSLPELTRALRAGGVKIGSGSMLDANAALAAVGLAARDDVRAALCATLIRDPADLALFEHVFDAFFPLQSWTLPGSDPLTAKSKGLEAPPAARRLAQSLASRGDVQLLRGPDRHERIATGTESRLERLASKDFEQMTVAELEAARRLIAAAPARSTWRRSRRWESDSAGRSVDLKRMLRSRQTDIVLFRAPQWRPRDWVLLIDISGSMAVYSRMFLHFAHALSRGGGRIETFVFATRLTRVTRELKESDPDAAMRAVSRRVPDWDGGTRLGESLAEFSRLWGRRVLGRGAQVLLLTDGLERDGIEVLDLELARLVRSSHELVWINPLRRHAGYQPLAAGAGVLARHAHRNASAHNLDTILDLARMLGPRV